MMTREDRERLLVILSRYLEIEPEQITAMAIVVKAQVECRDCGDPHAAALGLIANPSDPAEIMDLLDRGVKIAESLVLEVDDGGHDD